MEVKIGSMPLLDHVTVHQCFT